MKKFLALVVTFVLFTTPIVAQETYDQEGNGKNAGIAINPVLLLFNWGSAEINLWNISRNAEINIPFQYAKNPFFIDQEEGVDEELTFWGTGVYYRHFFSKKQEGFFAQAGWQYISAKAREGDLESSGSLNSILFGFGYRIISDGGLFWGCGLAVGRTWGKVDDPDPTDEDKYGSTLIFDIDLLKFGYAW